MSAEAEKPSSPPRVWPRSLLGRLRDRLRGRPDSEHEQALIRIGFAVAIGAYVLLVPAEGPNAASALRAGLRRGFLDAESNSRSSSSAGIQ